MKEILLLLILSILPTIIILWYFYRKDKYNKEPKKVLLKLFLLSAIITIPLAILFQTIIEAFSPAGIIGIFISAFISAALIEECLKYWMVKRFVFHKPYFDEVIDGIVYAVTASLGFATLENILYIFGDPEGLSVAIIRAFTAVPAHALDGALLGYFLGLAKFAPEPGMRKKLIRRGLLYAITFHGLYDFFLFTDTLLALLIIPLLLIQFRLVQIAIVQSFQEKPLHYIPLKINNIFKGWNIWDIFKSLFGISLILVSLLGVIGIFSDPENSLSENMETLFFFIVLIIIGVFQLRAVRNLHEKKTL